ncbi:unnamed protein product [Nippostrongylus brasiliensis]|uniref:Recep_L_domain domain-containing protein n=1 Tax=Nippostrongylus brasiliensis TaxID=27835 RepID=A0A0N4Y8C7_NIPBR|nr:unnamed protein product [Nippostrongylus brasiliensis]
MSSFYSDVFLDPKKLEKIFENVTALIGIITVQNTNLKRINFLKNLVNMKREFNNYVINITGNPLLTEINIGKLRNVDGGIMVRRNPSLNMTTLCKAIDKVAARNRLIAGNKVDCAIPPERLAVFHSVKKILGCLSVQETNFESLSFLENLEEIDCQDSSTCALSVVGNDYLLSLGLPKLKKINTTISIETLNNRELEFGYAEMDRLLSATNIPTSRLNGDYPTGDLPPGWCYFKSWENDLEALDENCTTLVGVIDYEGRAFTELELKRIGQIRVIYGNINLYAMTISNLSIFGALERVISLNNSFAAIEMNTMPSLVTPELPKIRQMYTPGSSLIAFNKCPYINITLEYCSRMEGILGEPVYIDTMMCSRWIHEKDVLIESP